MQKTWGKKEKIRRHLPRPILQRVNKPAWGQKGIERARGRAGEIHQEMGEGLTGK